MNNQKYNDVEKRINFLQNEFEAGRITSNDMTKDEAMLLSFIYQLKTIELENKLAYDDILLANYKTRLKNAIEYLKKKKNFDL